MPESTRDLLALRIERPDRVQAKELQKCTSSVLVSYVLRYCDATRLPACTKICPEAIG